MKYIDAEKIKAEIARLKGQLIRGACAAQIEMETNCKDEAYNEVLAFIDSLQQEQPEVDLEKAARYVYESWMGGTMDDVRRDMVELARHFYELGKRAK